MAKIDELLKQATESLQQKAQEESKKSNVPQINILKMDAKISKKLEPSHHTCYSEPLPEPAACTRISTTSCQTRVEAAIETAGDKWYNLPATELTPELKNDFFVLKSRNLLDPKRHYKRDTRLANSTPKFFHVARIVEGAHEFYSARLTRKERKNTLVEELLADKERRAYFKQKAMEISDNKLRGSRKYVQMKKDKRKMRQ